MLRVRYCRKMGSNCVIGLLFYPYLFSWNLGREIPSEDGSDSPPCGDSYTEEPYATSQSRGQYIDHGLFLNWE
jgi:hypothetical protein